MNPNPIFQVGAIRSKISNDDSIVFSIQEFDQKSRKGTGDISTCTMKNEDIKNKKGVCFMTLPKSGKRVELNAFSNRWNFNLRIKDGGDHTFVTPTDYGLVFSGSGYHTCDKMLPGDPNNPGDEPFTRCRWDPVEVENSGVKLR